MNRRVLFFAALALAGALLVPTGAVPFSGPTDDIGESIELAPSDGPNGTYAYFDQNDELAIDISPSNPNTDVEGVSPDGVTRFDDVFRVRYNGSRFAHIWITTDSEAITFHTRERPIDSESENVTLGPNGTVPVGLTVDTTGGVTDIDSDEFTVHARVAEPEDSEPPSSSDGAAPDDSIVSNSGGDGGDEDENDETDGGTESDDGEDGVGDETGDVSDGDSTGDTADGSGGVDEGSDAESAVEGEVSDGSPEEPALPLGGNLLIVGLTFALLALLVLLLAARRFTEK